MSCNNQQIRQRSAIVRPLFHKTTDELERLFRECAASPDQLTNIAAELIHRKRPKAVALQKRVEDFLAKRGEVEASRVIPLRSEIESDTSIKIVSEVGDKSHRSAEVPLSTGRDVLPVFKPTKSVPPPTPSSSECEPLKPRQIPKFISLPAPSRSSPKDGILAWISWIVPALLACITFALLSPGTLHYGIIDSPPQPVEVSSYTRSDGTSVSGYNRALPGDRSSAEAINGPIRSRNRQEKKRVEDGDM